ncbi:MAG: GNAT family N-acetyltransferase [Candidatus Zixiibacteriota bacterium]
MLVFTTNKKRLVRHFRKDPVLFGYHIGDLDDFFFPDCLWTTLVGEHADIGDVILTYVGGDTPTVHAFGLGNAFETLLREYLPIAPKQFYCHFQKQHHGVFRDFADESPLGTHLKMKLDPAAFTRYQAAAISGVGRPGPTQLSRSGPRHHHDGCSIVRLDPSHEAALLNLYAIAYPDNYFTPRMLQTGKYFGCVHNGSIIAVAGVHVVSDEHKIAVLGNITTHPDHRGRGLATDITSALVAELASEEKLVCLNVKADNAPALACYRKLGFVPVHEYEESLFELR